jgi:hypothetical protein
VFRAILMVLFVSGLVLSPADLQAKGGEGRQNKQQSKQQLVNRVLVGAGWQLDAIPVINRSSYDRASVEYAVQLWATTEAPQLSVRHESPALCSDVKPMRNAIILCDAVPQTGPASSGIAGFTANYTQPKKRGKRSRSQQIQASVIWLYPPRWSNESILHYIPSHELGHALGLDEMDCTCVMTPIVSDIDDLGPEERAAIAAIY